MYFVFMNGNGMMRRVEITLSGGERKENDGGGESN
jgi:hypothetical protein